MKHISLTRRLFCLVSFTLLPGSGRRHFQHPPIQRLAAHPFDYPVETPTKPIRTFLAVGLGVVACRADVSMATPWTRVCLFDRREQLLWSLWPGMGLRLNAFPQIRALSTELRAAQLRTRKGPWRGGVASGVARGWWGVTETQDSQTGASLWVSDIPPILLPSSVNNHLNYWRDLHTACAVFSPGPAGQWLIWLGLPDTPSDTISSLYRE